MTGANQTEVTFLHLFVIAHKFVSLFFLHHARLRKYGTGNGYFKPAEVNKRTFLQNFTLR